MSNILNTAKIVDILTVSTTTTHVVTRHNNEYTYEIKFVLTKI